MLITWISVITMIIPFIIMGAFYLSYRFTEYLETHHRRHQPNHSHYYEICQNSAIYALHSLTRILAHTIVLCARAIHSYEIVGLERIRFDRPTILVYYHGVIPIDMFVMPAAIYLASGDRRVLARSIVDRICLDPICRIVAPYCFAGPLDQCVQTLRDGHLLQIAPGGAREALFASRRYETLWNGRRGFAIAAITANADIIPVFTRNIRETYRLPRWAQHIWRSLYEQTDLRVFAPMIGLFPVKLVTYIGEPIRARSEREIRNSKFDKANFRNGETSKAASSSIIAIDLANRVEQAIESMIARYQPPNATLYNAIVTDRLADLRILQSK